MERIKNAPSGIFEILHRNEEHTYNWEIESTDGEFSMWKYFDTLDWAECYCACYKGKAFVCGRDYGRILSRYEGAQWFLSFLSEVTK